MTISLMARPETTRSSLRTPHTPAENLTVQPLSGPSGTPPLSIPVLCPGSPHCPGTELLLRLGTVSGALQIHTNCLFFLSTEYCFKLTAEQKKNNWHNIKDLWLNLNQQKSDYTTLPVLTGSKKTHFIDSEHFLVAETIYSVLWLFYQCVQPNLCRCASPQCRSAGRRVQTGAAASGGADPGPPSLGASCIERQGTGHAERAELGQAK